jgi:hypothetical protein
MGLPSVSVPDATIERRCARGVLHIDIARVHQRPTMTAAQFRRERLAAGVFQSVHRMGRAVEPTRLPADNHQRHSEEVTTHVGEVIFLADRPFLVARFFENTRCLKPPQTVDQQAARQTDPALKRIEPADALKRQVKDHQDPAVTEQVKRAAGRVGLNPGRRTRRHRGADSAAAYSDTSLSTIVPSGWTARTSPTP